MLLRNLFHSELLPSQIVLHDAELLTLLDAQIAYLDVLSGASVEALGLQEKLNGMLHLIVKWEEDFAVGAFLHHQHAEKVALLVNNFEVSRVNRTN